MYTTLSFKAPLVAAFDGLGHFVSALGWSPKGCVNADDWKAGRIVTCLLGTSAKHSRHLQNPMPTQSRYPVYRRFL